MKKTRKPSKIEDTPQPHNLLREFWLQSLSKEELIHRFDKADRVIRAGLQEEKAAKEVRSLNGKILALKSALSRRKGRREHWTWQQVINRGRELHRKNKDWKRNTVAAQIQREMEATYPPGVAPDTRTIWNHLTFIPTTKRTPK